MANQTNVAAKIQAYRSAVSLDETALVTKLTDLLGPTAPQKVTLTMGDRTVTAEAAEGKYHLRWRRRFWKIPAGFKILPGLGRPEWTRVSGEGDVLVLREMWDGEKWTAPCPYIGRAVHYRHYPEDLPEGGYDALPEIPQKVLESSFSSAVVDPEWVHLLPS